MFSARGRNLLFADADGATQFSDVSKLEAEMKKITADTVSMVCNLTTRRRQGLSLAISLWQMKWYRLNASINDPH